VYMLQFQWWLPVAYSLATIIFPLFVLLLRLKKSYSTADYYKLSNIAKLVMLTGIVSMVFFYFYL
jgi:4-hydroxybenzoate polyprenyltransferase